MTETTIGLDISKDVLDAHDLESGESQRFTNDAAGHKRLVAWAGQATGGKGLARAVYEPTGPYHRLLERALATAGFALVKVNPRQARRFAEATGKLAKTDRTDAAMLARMGAALQLPARPLQSDLLHDLKELLVARDALVRDRTAAKNRAKRLTLPLLRRQNARRLQQISRQIEAVEAAIAALIASDPALAQRFAILISIPGIGPLAAYTLLIEMPELGDLDGKQAASLAGLAPVARQSGRWTGRAFIRGGRANVRQALYMPALVAIRYNPQLEAVYKRLKAAGKPSKVAITAAMRKLITIANALLRDGRKWTEICP